MDFGVWIAQVVLDFVQVGSRILAIPLVRNKSDFEESLVGDGSNLLVLVDDFELVWIVRDDVLYGDGVYDLLPYVHDGQVVEHGVPYAEKFGLDWDQI